jgi:hypothetical protein
MKTDQERQELIQDIIVLLYQAYDSTLDDIHALLKRIDIFFHQRGASFN